MSVPMLHSIGSTCIAGMFLSVIIFVSISMCVLITARLVGIDGISSFWATNLRHHIHRLS